MGPDIKGCPSRDNLCSPVRGKPAGTDQAANFRRFSPQLWSERRSYLLPSAWQLSIYRYLLLKEMADEPPVIKRHKSKEGELTGRARRWCIAAVATK